MRPRRLQPSAREEESASYTRILDAEFHSTNRALADGEGSICANLEREKRGRLRRVDGTERDKAFGKRAIEKEL